MRGQDKVARHVWKTWAQGVEGVEDMGTRVCNGCETRVQDMSTRVVGGRIHEYEDVQGV